MNTTITIGNYTVHPVWNVISTILWVLGVISLWKIFEDRGEKGWKAIIPFYNTKIFGRIAGDEKLGSRTMRAQIWLVLLSIIVLMSSIFIYGFAIATATSAIPGLDLQNLPSSGELPPEILEALNSQVVSNAIPTELVLCIFALAVILIIIAIICLVRQIKLYNRFIVAESAASWLIIPFIFLPTLTKFYFAFIRGKYLDY